MAKSKPTLSKSEAEVRERPSQKIPNIICPIDNRTLRVAVKNASVAGRLTYCDDYIPDRFAEQGHFLPSLVELAKWVRDDDGQTKDSTPIDFQSRSHVPKVSSAQIMYEIWCWMSLVSYGYYRYNRDPEKQQLMSARIQIKNLERGKL
jgi:hypothetical protein